MPVQRIVIGQALTTPKVERAKQLRREMTPAEAALWQRLRGNRLAGLHFRRQQVIAGFIVDFYCHAAGVIVDIDGEVHQQLEAADAERDAILTAHGFVSLHLINDQVLNRIDDALATITSTCRQAIRAISESANPHQKVTLPLKGEGPGMRADQP